MFKLWAAGKGVSDPFSARGIAESEGMLDIITPSADRVEHAVLALLSVRVPQHSSSMSRNLASKSAP